MRWNTALQKRARRRLANWGRWAGGPIQDPALIHYYTVSPMWIGTKWAREESRPAIDEPEAERCERLLLKLRRESLEQFSLLRDRYAYGHHYARLAKSLGVSKSTMYLRLRDAEIAFAQLWWDEMHCPG